MCVIPWLETVEPGQQDNAELLTLLLQTLPPEHHHHLLLLGGSLEKDSPHEGNCEESQGHTEIQRLSQDPPCPASHGTFFLNPPPALMAGHDSEQE